MDALRRDVFRRFYLATNRMCVTTRQLLGRSDRGNGQFALVRTEREGGGLPHPLLRFTPFFGYGSIGIVHWIVTVLVVASPTSMSSTWSVSSQPATSGLE